ncbi:cytochrome c oxidase subunit 4 [Lysinibacter cavernae]|uniref:Cytochrome c oxidase polypeptide 4 n=1 Tax=Lysinibacter cavernae TaxID=1640652 RepID=A0A7X5QZN8_9MICO|nr:cytochrome c oxidase subunit 4 [Lysinibacter cavernae]NIH52760.1 membrane protein implicated in regulation of membrane protease activity [Lysinibacter cavernae]
MKSNVVILYLLTVFFLIVGGVYAFWTIQAYGHPEWAGSTAIILSAALTAFVGFYISRVEKSAGGVLPEDRLDADIDDGDPEIGEFSPWSWWPMVLAGAAGLLLVGLSVGFWISFFAFPLLLVALVGWVYEYYRGHFAR